MQPHGIAQVEILEYVGGVVIFQEVESQYTPISGECGEDEGERNQQVRWEAKSRWFVSCFFIPELRQHDSGLHAPYRYRLPMMPTRLE